MKITSVQFARSVASLEECPPPTRPEFAFIGRSNVGKSSIINLLTGHKGIAKVSATPGKTRTINFFDINNRWYLVDLPGYGYAKVARAEQSAFNETVNDYLAARESLLLTFLLIDSRHKPQPIDLEFAAWLASEEIPFIIVFTKADKISRQQLDENCGRVLTAMDEAGIGRPEYLTSSAARGFGRGDILNRIDSEIRQA